MRLAALFPRTFAAAAFELGLMIVASHAWAVTTFNDGGVHDINGASDQLEILDGPGNAPTTVNVHAGAVVGDGLTNYSANVRDNSSFNMSGGSLFDELFLFDNSSAHLTGGSIGDDLTPDNNATVLVDFVTVLDDVEANGAAQVTINNGNFDEDIEANGNARISIFGGMFQTGTDGADVTASNNSVIDIHGGNFGVGHTDMVGGFYANNDAIINFYGGDISNQPQGLNASGNATINVYGLDSQPASMTTTAAGQINLYGGITSFAANGSGIYQLLGGGSLLTSFQSNGTTTLYIRGNGFAANGTTRPYGLLTTAAGILTGTLADGSMLNVTFSRGATIGPTIILAPIPEPGALLLAGLASMGLVAFRTLWSERY